MQFSKNRDRETNIIKVVINCFSLAIFSVFKNEVCAIIFHSHPFQHNYHPFSSTLFAWMREIRTHKQNKIIFLGSLFLVLWNGRNSYLCKLLQCKAENIKQIATQRIFAEIFVIIIMLQKEEILVLMKLMMIEEGF
jgi:hypothetical protein